MIAEAEQNHTSIVYGDRLVLKLFRRLEAGIHPEVEIGRVLSGRRFPHAVVLAFDPQGAGARPEGTYAERLRGLDDTELLSRFVRDVRGSDAEAAELALMGDALTAGRVAELSS